MQSVSQSTQVTWLVVTEVWSESFGLVTEHRHYNARPSYASCSYVAQVLFFILKYDIPRFLCTMLMLCVKCVLDVRASSSSLVYSSVKFHFCHALHWWASPRRKIAYSITQLIWFAWNQSFSFCFGKLYFLAKPLTTYPTHQTKWPTG